MKRVLIVEDQRMPRKYMERMISDSKKYALADSVSGADVALAYCQRQPIDIILMDVCTAGNKDGIEAASEIKAVFPNIKIIIVTSMVEVGFLERAKAAKVDSFFIKSSTDFLIIFSNLRKCRKGLEYQAFPAFCVSEDTPHIMAFRSLTWR